MSYISGSLDMNGYITGENCLKLEPFVVGVVRAIQSSLKNSIKTTIFSKRIASHNHSRLNIFYNNIAESLGFLTDFQGNYDLQKII